MAGTEAAAIATSTKVASMGVDTKGYIHAFIIQSNLPLILNIITKM